MGGASQRQPEATSLAEAQAAALDLMASGASLRRVLERLCTAVEDTHARSAERSLCSILLVTEDGAHLRHGAAPRLPEAYCRLIDGLAIGPGVGSCGTAAYTRKAVIVEDIARDPLWRGYEGVAASFGLASCASTPIFGGPDRRLLGTFAIYRDKPGPFPTTDLEHVRALSTLAAVAILDDERVRGLRASESRWARAERVSRVMEVRVDLDGRWKRLPEALCAMLGRTEADLLAGRFQDILHPDDLRADHARYDRLIRGEIDAFESDCRLLTADGGSAWTSLSCTSERDAEGRPSGLVIYVTDAARKKHAEETLQACQRMDGLAAFAPGLAHDFNNLLTAILCSASLARSAVDRESAGSEEAIGSLENIETTARRAADLTRQLLVYAGSVRLPKKPVDVNVLARELTEILSASFLKNVRVDLELGASLPAVMGTPAQLQQVIMNLVINAAQAIGEAEGRVVVRTRGETLDAEQVHARFAGAPISPGEHLVLEVEDDGCGMDAELRAKIFEPFFTTKKSGRGLGLAVLQGILREHRAGMEVVSEVGRGTVFRVYLPAAPAARWQRASMPPPSAPPRWPVPRGVVLVGDADPVIGRAVGQLFGGLGFEVLPAPEGQEVLLQLVKRADVALLLLDLSVPRLGGREALQIARERWPALPIVVTTGDEAEAEALADEGLVVLRKPYGLADLQRAVFGGDHAGAIGETSRSSAIPG
jgi:PAS domain S-box-containing protein